MDLLILDDNKGVLNLFQETCAVKGYSVDVVSTISEAMGKLGNKYKVVVADHNIEGSKSKNFLGAYKKLHPEVSTILYSRYLIDETTKLNADVCLPNIQDFNGLFGTIKVMLDQKGEQRIIKLILDDINKLKDKFRDTNSRLSMIEIQFKNIKSVTDKLYEIVTQFIQNNQNTAMRTVTLLSTIFALLLAVAGFINFKQTERLERSITDIYKIIYTPSQTSQIIKPDTTIGIQ